MISATDVIVKPGETVTMVRSPGPVRSLPAPHIHLTPSGAGMTLVSDVACSLFTGVAVLEGPMYAVGGHDGWSYLSTVER